MSKKRSSGIHRSSSTRESFVLSPPSSSIAFLVFWKGALIFGAKHKGAMGHFGRITSISDLPDGKTLAGYVRKAAELNEAGVRKSRPRSHAKQRVNVPPSLKTALQKM